MSQPINPPRRALDPEQIKRAHFGILPDLSALFSEFAYVGESYEYRTEQPGIRRVHRRFHTFPDGFYFLSVRDCPTIDQSFSTFVKQGYALCAKPTAAALRYTLNRSCEGRVGSFELIAWPHTGYALITGHDSTGIANPWLAFVPLDALPTINMENTPSIAGVKGSK